MANLREILVEWTMASGSGKVSVLYFDASVSVASQRTAINTLLTSTLGALDNSVSYRIATSGKEVDDATGTLTNAWVETSTKSGIGAGSGEQVADATQLLFRWKTSAIVGGRFLQGRTYIPGLFAGNLSNGNVSASTVTGLNTALATFVGSSSGFRIWHRPSAGSGGTSSVVTGGTVWTELAVLRRRRG